MNSPAPVSQPINIPNTIREEIVKLKCEVFSAAKIHAEIPNVPIKRVCDLICQHVVKGHLEKIPDRHPVEYRQIAPFCTAPRIKPEHLAATPMWNLVTLLQAELTKIEDKAVKIRAALAALED